MQKLKRAATMMNQHRLYRSLFVPRLLTKPKPCAKIRQTHRKEFHTSTRKIKKAEWPEHSKSAFDDLPTKPFPGEETASKFTFLSKKAKETADTVGRTIQQTSANLASSAAQTLSRSSRTASKSLSNAASRAASKANESARNLTLKANQSAKTAVLKAAESGRTMASKSAESAPRVMSSMLQFAKDRSSNLLRAAGNFAVSSAQTSLLLMGNSFQKALKVGSSKLASSARAQVRPMIEYVENSGGSVARQFWWWSLAAVGIYGVATTVPKELIRATFENRKSKEEDKRD